MFQYALYWLYWIQESIYIFILHCRILTSPGAKRGAEAFENGFSWIPGQWSCRHTHTVNGHCLKIRVQCQGTGALGGRTRLGCFELLGGRTRWGCFASKDISQTLMMSTVLHGSCLVNFWPFSHGTCPATILSWKNHFSGSNILIFSYQRGRMDQSKALCPVDDHPLTCFGAWLQAEDFVDTIWVSSHV